MLNLSLWLYPISFTMCFGPLLSVTAIDLWTNSVNALPRRVQVCGRKFPASNSSYMNSTDREVVLKISIKNTSALIRAFYFSFHVRPLPLRLISDSVFNSISKAKQFFHQRDDSAYTNFLFLQTSIQTDSF